MAQTTNPKTEKSFYESLDVGNSLLNTLTAVALTFTLIALLNQPAIVTFTGWHLFASSATPLPGYEQYFWLGMITLLVTQALYRHNRSLRRLHEELQALKKIPN